MHEHSSSLFILNVDTYHALGCPHVRNEKMSLQRNFPLSLSLYKSNELVRNEKNRVHLVGMGSNERNLISTQLDIGLH